MPFMMSKTMLFDMKDGNPYIGVYMDWRGEVNHVRAMSLYGKSMLNAIKQYLNIGYTLG